jgi:CheY-like chemotaxis protein
MSPMGGDTRIENVRALPPEQGGVTRAVALTAFARSEDRRQAMLVGFDIHVAKPVEPGELVAVVSRLARRACPPARGASPSRQPARLAAVAG